MKKDDLYTMELLKLVENNSRVTQRHIADTLKISLGLTNSFIKRLAKKGYIKITTIPIDRAKYLLTPKGIMEKYRLTVEYMHYSLNFYKDLKTILREKFNILKMENVRKVVFYGSGEVAEIAKLFLEEAGIELVGIVDDENAGKLFFGHVIKKCGEINSFDYNKVISTKIDLDRTRAEERLRDLVDKSKIFTIR